MPAFGIEGDPEARGTPFRPEDKLSLFMKRLAYVFFADIYGAILFSLMDDVLSINRSGISSMKGLGGLLRNPSNIIREAA